MVLIFLLRKYLLTVKLSCRSLASVSYILFSKIILWKWNYIFISLSLFLFLLLRTILLTPQLYFFDNSNYDPFKINSWHWDLVFFYWDLTNIIKNHFNTFYPSLTLSLSLFHAHTHICTWKFIWIFKSHHPFHFTFAISSQNDSFILQNRLRCPIFIQHRKTFSSHKLDKSCNKNC